MIHFVTNALQSGAGNRARQLGAWIYGCYAWLVFSLILLSFGGLATVMQQPRSGRRVAHLGTRILFRLAGMPISVKGLERLPAVPHLLLVNHTSFLDALILTALLPPRPGYAFVARQQYSSQALFWPLLRALGTVILVRSGKQHERSNVDLMRATLRRGENLVVFPEGGFVRDPGLKSFHSGAFVAAANAGVPIVVAGLRGAREALPLGRWMVRRAPLALEIGPLFKLDDDDPDTLLKTKRAAWCAMVPLTGEFDTSS